MPFTYLSWKSWPTRPGLPRWKPSPSQSPGRVMPIRARFPVPGRAAEPSSLPPRPFPFLVRAARCQSPAWGGRWCRTDSAALKCCMYWFPARAYPHFRAIHWRSLHASHAERFTVFSGPSHPEVRGFRFRNAARSRNLGRDPSRQRQAASDVDVLRSAGSLGVTAGAMSPLQRTAVGGEPYTVAA